MRDIQGNGPGTESTASGSQAVRQMFDASLCKMHYDLGDRGESQAPWSVAYFGGIQLDGIDIYRDEGIGFRRVLRNPIDIADDPADEFLLAMPFSARINMAQAGRLEHCEPGRAILFSTAQPFSSHIAAGQAQGHYAQYLARVSGAMLRQRVPNIDDLSNRCFDVQNGPGRIVKALFDAALEQGHEMSREQSALFSRMLIDAIANVALGLVAAPGGPRPAGNTSFERVRRMATHFIDCHLSDPALDVVQIAAHCKVSPRYVHAAFAAAAMKVGVYVRDTRLQQCRNALLNPAMHHKSITDIALQWGFDDPAHFSRAYKARFGLSPRQERSAERNIQVADGLAPAGRRNESQPASGGIGCR